MSLAKKKKKQLSKNMASELLGKILEFNNIKPFWTNSDRNYNEKINKYCIFQTVTRIIKHNII